MSVKPALFVSLLTGLARTLASGSRWFTDFSTERFGLQLPPAVLNAPGVSDATAALEQAAGTLAERADALAAVGTDTGQLIQLTVQMADALRLFITNLGDLVGALETAISSQIPVGPQRDAALAFTGKLAVTLLNRLLAEQIEKFSQGTLLALTVLGIADWELKDAEVPAAPNSKPFLEKQLRLDRIKDLISDPARHFADTIGWGTPAFDPTRFFEIYRSFWNRETAIRIEEIGGRPTLRFGDLTISQADLGGQVGLEALFTLALREGISERLNISDEWGFDLDAAFNLEGQVGMTIAPPFEVELTPPAASTGGRVALLFDRNESARPWQLLDTGGLLSLSVNNVAAGVGLAAEVSTGGKLSFEPMLVAELDEAHLRIGSGEADNFLANLIAGAELEGIFDIAFEFTPSGGLRVRASGGVEIMIPIHRDLGPLRLDELFLGLFVKEDGALEFEASLGLAANLGPLVAVVERMGAKNITSFLDEAAAGEEAEFGNIANALKFKPPTGIGLSLDVGIMKGGGYLYIDVDRGEYAGALELTFAEWISLKAIGLISTRMPDGSKGFSLLIIITVEFGSGLQLGFGFTLLGVGGLLGLNRRTDIEPLTRGVQTGAVESVMFPQNIIENAPRIISDLRQFFPVEVGTFLVGPMVKIGWGTPTLLSLSMGIIIEVPKTTITILGILKVVLPTEELAVLRLQVNFIGRIEFDNKLAWFFAVLYDSRILYITLEGGMGVLINWGDQSNFVVSVGGFHPDYTPPPLPFDEPARIAVSLLNTSYARIRIEGYFAVTSNSVQFGARAELYFGVSKFKIEGHLGFDALFIFSPFYFSFSISVSLSVKVFGIGLFSVGFSGKLEGPTPWHIKGKGSISLLFFKLKVPFETTWGETRNTELPPIEVLPLLEAELNAITNWRAELPTGTNLLVSLRKLGDDAADQLVLHPVGSLAVSQTKVPLGLELEKFGSQKPSDVRELAVSLAGSDFSKLADREEKFAIGHFKDLKAAEKLSKPAFQPLKSGLELSAAGEQTKTGGATARTLRYEQILIDGAFRRRIIEQILALLRLIAALFAFGHRSAVRQNELSHGRKTDLIPPGRRIELKADQYVVARRADNRLPGEAETFVFNSPAQAQDFMTKERRINPAGTAALHVIPATELNQSA
ncbi:MAG: DUF6603 domain-containing protein [Saprospiraceae bacterium]